MKFSPRLICLFLIAVILLLLAAGVFAYGEGNKQESTPPFLLTTNMTRIRSTPILEKMAFNTYFHYTLQAGEYEELIDQEELSNMVNDAVKEARKDFTGEIFNGDRRPLEAFMDEAVKADFVLKQKGIVVEKVIVVN